MPITERQRRRREDAKLAYAAFIEYYPLTIEDLPDEVWKAIDEHYQISTLGRVKSFWKKPPRILKPQLFGEYLSVNLYTGGKLKSRRVHILVARAFIPNPDDGHKFNCHVSNLYWASTIRKLKSRTRRTLSISATIPTTSRRNNSLQSLASTIRQSAKFSWARVMPTQEARFANQNLSACPTRYASKSASIGQRALSATPLSVKNLVTALRPFGTLFTRVDSKRLAIFLAPAQVAPPRH